MEVRRAFQIFALLTILGMIADRILFVIFPNYLLEKGFSASEIGLIFSIASLLLLISRSFIGKLSDFLGRKLIMSIGLLSQSVATFLYPVIGKLHEFIFTKSLEEVSETLKSSVEDAIMADVFKKKIRAKILAKLGTLYPLSRGLAMLLGFLVVTYFSITLGFWVAGSSLFFSFVIFSLLFKEEKKKVRVKMRFSIRKYSKPFKLIALIGMLQAINFTASYFPAFFILARSLGITESLLFLLLLGNYLISSVFTYQSRNWIDKVGREKVVMLGSLVFSIFIFLYPFSRSILQFFLILLGVSISYYIWRVAFKTVLMDKTEARIRGEQVGFAKTLQGIGDMIGPVIGGFLIDNISLSSAFFFAGGVGLVSVVLSYLLQS